MIGFVERTLAAAVARFRGARRAVLIEEWNRRNPGKCARCAYLRWAKDFYGVTLVLDGAHVCQEKVERVELPTARTVSR